MPEVGDRRGVVRSLPSPDGKRVKNIYVKDGKLVVEYEEGEE